MLDENTWKTTTVGRAGTETGVMPKFDEVDAMIFFLLHEFYRKSFKFQSAHLLYIEDENEITQILSLVTAILIIDLIT